VIWVENLKVRDHFVDVDTNRRLILKWIFKNMYMVHSGELDLSGSQKGGVNIAMELCISKMVENFVTK
jgi:hypothetical protein